MNNELEKYSIEELQAEIMRRRQALRKERGDTRNLIPSFMYATATVKEAHIEGRKGTWYCVLEVHPMKEPQFGTLPEIYSCRCHYSMTKDSAPKVGDTVELRKRITRFSNKWGIGETPTIYRVIERATE